MVGSHTDEDCTRTRQSSHANQVLRDMQIGAVKGIQERPRAHKAYVGEEIYETCCAEGSQPRAAMVRGI